MLFSINHLVLNNMRSIMSIIFYLLQCSIIHIMPGMKNVPSQVSKKCVDRRHCRR